MEALLALRPLHIIAGAEARRAAYRLKYGGQWKPEGRTNGHTCVLQLAEESNPLLAARTDGVTPTFAFNKKYITTIPEREDWDKPEELFRSAGLVWYTDGSKTEKGSGASVYSERPRAKMSWALDKFAIVFQTEIFAILTCAQENLQRGYSNKNIYICSDSQASFAALDSVKTNTLLVADCRWALNELGIRNCVRLIWVPGHRNIKGNKEADLLAREGSKRPPTGPEPILRYPMTSARLRMENWSRNQFNSSWAHQPGMRQAKQLVKGPLPKRSEQLLNLNRRHIRIVLGLLTGHGHFNKHLHTMGLVTSPCCSYCEMEDETAIHILTNCPCLMMRRLQLLGAGLLRPRDIWEVPIGKLLAFGL